MNNKKKLMLEALKEQLGIITAAAKQTGIDRRTHYRWLVEDPEYKARVEEIPDMVIDFAENALFKLMQEKNPTAIIFFLKTHAKHRGYIENPLIYQQNNLMNPDYRIEIINPNDNSNKVGTNKETVGSLPDSTG
jgi:hypothetical protein